MNTNEMAIISLGVIVALFVVLVGFIRYLTKTLLRTGANLQRALHITTAIRHDCEGVNTGIQAMNTNLYRVAAGLQNVGDATERRVATLAAPEESLSLSSSTTLEPPGHS